MSTAIQQASAQTCRYASLSMSTMRRARTRRRRRHSRRPRRDAPITRRTTVYQCTPLRLRRNAARVQRNVWISEGNVRAVQRHGVRLALELDRREWLEPLPPFDARVRTFTDEESRGLGDRAQPRAHVHGVADARVLGAPLVADEPATTTPELIAMPIASACVARAASSIVCRPRLRAPRDRRAAAARRIPPSGRRRGTCRRCRLRDHRIGELAEDPVEQSHHFLRRDGLAKLVKSRMSANSTVTSRFSPREHDLPDWSTCFDDGVRGVAGEQLAHVRSRPSRAGGSRRCARPAPPSTRPCGRSRRRRRASRSAASGVLVRGEDDHR